MADFIYNNFPQDDNNNNGLGYGYNPYYPQPQKQKSSNIAIILVCVFFGILILLTSIFGFILVGKVSTSSINKQNIDSMIFSTPTSNSTPVNPSATTPSPDGVTEYKTYSEVIYAVKDSVVEIRTQISDHGTVVSESAGSGVIIGSYKIDGVDGGYYVVTNAHVVESSNGVVSDKITITTTDGNVYPVTTVRGTDAFGDIAVLMVNTTDKLTGVNFGNSDNLILGQEVIAIGNPLGELGGTCTNGIISALDREVVIDGTTFNLLQTNAAINQGNSGGGLFNMKGQLVGIINAKSIGEGVEGIGFAIPSNDAKEIVEYLIAGSFLGITVAEAQDSFSAPYVYVHDLEKGYNDSVLQKMDVILSLNGVDISSVQGVREVLRALRPGDTITASIRRDNEFLDVTLTVYQKP